MTVNSTMRCPGGAAMCEAMVTSSLTGRRCRKPALPDTCLPDGPTDGQPRCETHLAIRYSEKGFNNIKCKNGEGYMTRFYIKTLRPALAAKIEQILEESKPLEQLDLSEEVALVRVAALDAVKIYDDAVASGAGASVLLSSGMMMKAALSDVAKIVEAQGRVEEQKGRLTDVFSQVMAAVITSVTRAAWEVWGDDYRVKHFESKIREHLEIRVGAAGVGSDGTQLTPDMDAVDMDSTIPRLGVEDGQANGAVAEGGEERAEDPEGEGDTAG